MPENSTTKSQILVVDDEEEHAQVMCEALTRLATCMTRDETETERQPTIPLPALTQIAPRHARRSF